MPMTRGKVLPQKTHKESSGIEDRRSIWAFLQNTKLRKQPNEHGNSLYSTATYYKVTYQDK